MCHKKYLFGDCFRKHCVPNFVLRARHCNYQGDMTVHQILPLNPQKCKIYSSSKPTPVPSKTTSALFPGRRENQIITLVKMNITRSLYELTVRPFPLVLKQSKLMKLHHVTKPKLIPTTQLAYNK